MKVIIINGPNLNSLGKRDKSLYGNKTLEQINSSLLSYAQKNKIILEFFQSNIEGELVGKIQEFSGDAIVINAGAYTHYSLAIKDALNDKPIIKVEVHLSNILAREEERKTSVISPVCDGIISGFLDDSYLLALKYIKLKKQK